MRSKCRHEWVVIGYGGCGWLLLQCTKCGAKEIDA